MRKSDIALSADITAAIGDLHRKCSDGIQVAWEVHRLPPNPIGLYSNELWWNRTITKLAAKWGLSELASASLRGALPDAINRVVRSPGFGYASSRNQQVITALDALDQWRRDWAWKARQMAVTENTRAESERVAAGGGGMFKRWVSERDDRVRVTHSDAASRPPIPVQQPFMVGGWPMMFPGDPMGPAQEVVGCRCELKVVNG